MENLPNFRHLSALPVIARLGSISAASEAVHLSQPALTQALARIEQALGAALFERSAAGMRPTDAGAAFLVRVQRALACLQSFSRDVVPGRRACPFTTTQLRAVMEVVEHGNVSVAAASLGLSQPSVHRSAREAEAICGQPLFHRIGGGVEATPTAKRLARLASQAFAEIRQGIDDVGDLLGRRNGQLRIGSLPLARTSLVPAAVTRLLERFPDARVSIVDGPYEELLDRLLHGQVDLILGALREQPVKDVEQRFLFEDPLALVVRSGHPLLSRKRLELRTLARLDWVAPRQGTPARQRFRKLFLAHGLEPPSRLIECSSSVATRGLLLQSDRVALLSTRQVQPEMDAGFLAALPIRLGVHRPIGLTLRRNWQPTALQSEYLALLGELAGEQ